MAGRIGARLVDHVDLEDLVSYGLFGLMEAIDRFDPERGFKFETFATPRIRGAVLDELRHLDWAPRQVRRRERRLKRTREELAHRLGRWPSTEEVAEHLELTEEQVAEAEADVSTSHLTHLDRPLGEAEDAGTLRDVIVDPRAIDPAGTLEEEDARRELAEAIQGLGERERLVVTLYYYEGLTLQEIGEILEVTESRISQIHRAGVRRLQRRLAPRSVSA